MNTWAYRLTVSLSECSKSQSWSALKWTYLTGFYVKRHINRNDRVMAYVSSCRTEGFPNRSNYKVGSHFVKLNIADIRATRHWPTKHLHISEELKKNQTINIYTWPKQEIAHIVRRKSDRKGKYLGTLQDQGTKRCWSRYVNRVAWGSCTQLHSRTQSASESSQRHIAKMSHWKCYLVETVIHIQSIHTHIKVKVKWFRYRPGVA